MAVEYISDTEGIINVFWSHLQQDGAAAFKLSERSHMPPAISANNLRGGQTQVLNIRQMKRIDCHPVESDEDSASEIISDTKNQLNWNC